MAMYLYSRLKPLESFFQVFFSAFLPWDSSPFFTTMWDEYMFGTFSIRIKQSQIHVTPPKANPRPS